MPTLVPYPGRARGGASATMGVPVTRDGRQSLARHFWPVVLVPGIMGSRIERADGSDRIWDPDRTRFMLWLMSQSPDARTRLYDYRLTPGRTMRTIYDAANNTPAEGSAEASILPDRNARNWGSVSWEYYGPGCVGIQEDIAPEGGVLWCFGYDWRDSNIANGERLRDFINNTVRPTSPYKPIIVTHSMGGLVTRAACRMYGVESMAAGVIHTMMPTHGAAEAYGGPKHGSMSFPFRFLVGNTAREIACVTSGVAGMFQLMPSPLYPNRAWLTIDPRFDSHCSPPGPYPLTDPYRMYRESNGLVGLVDHATFNADVVDVGANTYVNNTRRVLQHTLDNITEAERYHSTEVRDYCHPSTWLIAGTNQATTTSCALVFHQETVYGVQLNPTVEGTLTETMEGDATVPLVSARVLESNPNCRGGFIVQGVVHANSTNDPGVINAIGDLIRASRAEGMQRW